MALCGRIVGAQPEERIWALGVQPCKICPEADGGGGGGEVQSGSSSHLSAVY